MQEATASGIENDARLPIGCKEGENLRIAEGDEVEAAIAVKVDGVDAPDVVRERKCMAFEARRDGGGRRHGTGGREKGNQIGGFLPGERGEQALGHERNREGRFTPHGGGGKRHGVARGSPEREARGGAGMYAVWSKNSKPPISRDLPSEQTVARRPSHGLILLNELEANVGVYLRFG